MKISLVAAVSENGVIGRDGDLPWELPDDQRFFKRLTRGHCVVMGRATFESIGSRPLPRRTNIVVSRRADYAPAGAERARDLDEALELARRTGEEEVFIVGGEGLYREALPRADRVYLTRVHAEVKGDTRFPSFDPGPDDADWACVDEEHHPVDARHAIAFTIQRWERRR